MKIERRIQYAKRHNGFCTNIICEVASDGQTVFWESGPGEVRWHEFEPSALERRKAQQLLHRQMDQDGKAFMDLDALCSLRRHGRSHRRLRVFRTVIIDSDRRP